MSRFGNYALGFTLAVLVGLAQIPPYNAPPAIAEAAIPEPVGDTTLSVASTAPSIVVRSTPPPARDGGSVAATTSRSLAPEQLTGYRWPVQYATITTWFAPTDRGFVVINGKRVHDGVDLASGCGDAVTAAHDGTVLHAGREFDKYLGYNVAPDAFYKTVRNLSVLPIVVVVDDGNGYRSAYVHLSSASVRAGEKIKAGQPIGAEGATGHATGCHLHYSLIRMDAPFQQVAPEFVKMANYPPYVRARVDPLRVLSFLQRGAPRQLPSIPPPNPPIR